MTTEPNVNCDNSDDIIAKLSKEKTISFMLGGNKFMMVGSEWTQLDSWIRNHQQEIAIRWWKEQFQMAFSAAVYCINLLQVMLECGELRQKVQEQLLQDS